MNRRIRFERTVNIGNFSNFKLGAERDLSEDEVLEGAVQALQSVVDALCDARYVAVVGGPPPPTLARPLPPRAARPAESDWDEPDDV